MTQRSYPFVGAPTTSSEFSRMFRTVFPASVLDGLAVSADSSGLNVQVSAGNGYVRGHYYESTASETLPIEPGESQPRIDTVVLRLEYGSVNTVELAVKKGTAAASPTPPELDQTEDGIYEKPLGNVAVAASAVTISAANVTDRRIAYADAFKLILGALNVAWSAVTGKPSSFPPAAHSHTWESVTGRPSSFPPSAHSHTWESIAGKPSSFAPAAHSHSWDSITGRPSTFAPSGHNHSASDITSGQLASARLADNSVTSRVLADGSVIYAGLHPTLEERLRYGIYGGTVLSSTGVYNNNITTTRRAMWIASNGDFGHTASSIRYKKNVKPWPEMTEDEQFAELQVVTFQWKVAHADPENPGAIEVGMIAEHLHDLGLTFAVFYEPDALGILRPEGIHYDRLVLLVIPYLQRVGARVAALEARLDAIGA